MNYTTSISIRKGNVTSVNILNDSLTLKQSVELEPIVVPIGSSWVTLPFGSISTAQFIFIKTDQDINIRLNGQSSDIKVTDWFLLRGETTGVSVQNIATSPATITFLLGEELTS